MNLRPRNSVNSRQVVQSLLDAYRRGYFPMADDPAPWNPLRTRQIHWFSPDPRGLLPLRESEGLHVSRSLERRLRSRWFEIRVNTAFEPVMRACADPRKPPSDSDPGGEDPFDPGGTWIDGTLIHWYRLLHEHGHAHSVECWRTDTDTGEHALVGGVYGVSIGAAFFGESMFHRPRPRNPDGSRHPLDGTDASKVALVTLVRALARAGYALFDTQMVTNHVATLGGYEIPRADYLRQLDKAINQPDRWPNVVI